MRSSSACLDNLREVFSGTIVPVQLPIGEGSEFKGVVDLVGMKAYMGEGATPSDIPANLAPRVEEARTQLIEAAAEGDDELIMKYLDGEELTAEEINRGLKAGIASGKVMCRSSAVRPSNNVGIRPLHGRDRRLHARAQRQRPSRHAHDGLTATRLSCPMPPARSRCSSSRPSPTRTSARSPTSGSSPASIRGDSACTACRARNEERVSQVFTRAARSSCR